VCKDRLPACYPRTHAHLPTMFPFAPACLQRLVLEALARGSGDNISCIVAFLNSDGSTGGCGAAAHGGPAGGCWTAHAAAAALASSGWLELELPLPLPACLPACLAPTADLPSLNLPPLPHCLCIWYPPVQPSACTTGGSSSMALPLHAALQSLSQPTRWATPTEGDARDGRQITQPA
jgi:hypothetical protein